MVMEASFERNQKKIGDEGFEYDIQVNFGQDDGAFEVETCEWDDDDDGDGDF